MKGAEILKGPAGWAVVIGVGGLVVWLLWNKAKQAGQAVLNVNRGTPYAGAGVVGTLGNATNQVLGGAPQSFGEWLGGSIYDLTHAAYDPNAVTADRNSPPQNASTVTNPVQASPAILPYSYKQATIDVPWLLNSDPVFTPSSGGGSAGAYSDSALATPDWGVVDPNSDNWA